jgi:hypothetical protein
MDRRALLTAGMAFGAGSLALATAGDAEAAAPGATPLGVSVSEYGVEPNNKGDQTAAIQKAINEISASGAPVIFPPGSYRAARLALPASASLIGAHGWSALTLSAPGPLLEADAAQQIRISGMRLTGAGQKSGAGLIVIKGGACVFHHCEIGDCSGAAVVAQQTSALDVLYCRFADCAEGLHAVSDGMANSPALIANNRLINCGLRVEGDASVTANIIVGAPGVGLWLGAKKATGRIMAAHNMVNASPIGIGVAAEGDGYYMLALNLISGAKDGAIRAFDKGKPIGPDLARSSAEAFRHLGMFGNVAQ